MARKSPRSVLIIEARFYEDIADKGKCFAVHDVDLIERRDEFGVGIEHCRDIGPLPLEPRHLRMQLLDAQLRVLRRVEHPHRAVRYRPVRARWRARLGGSPDAKQPHDRKPCGVRAH